MKSIEPNSRIIPVEDPVSGPEEVMIHPIPLPREEISIPVPPQRGRRGRHRAESRSWTGFADKVLQSWPATLRLAVLLMILLAGLAMIAAVIGIATPLLLVAGGYQMRQWLRRKPRANQ